MRTDVVVRESLLGLVGWALQRYVELVGGKLVRKLLARSVDLQLDHSVELIFVEYVLGLFGSIGVGVGLGVLEIVRKSCSLLRSIIF